MKATWVLAGLLLMAGSIAAACGSNGGSGFSSGGGSGPDASGGGDARSLVPPGSGSGTSTGTGLGTGPGGGGGPDASQPPAGAPHGCDPTCAAAGGQCVSKVCTIRENPGGVTATAQQQLNGAGTANSAFTWLYPYDQTVFPRGLIPPTMQFGGAAPEALMVRITYSSMDYLGYFAGSANASAKLPTPSWVAVTEGAWASDVVQVSVTELVGGHASTPIIEHWSIAQGNMRGQIYYETYGSQLAGGPDSVGIMSIAPGAAQPTVLKSGCGNVCHTASADGSTLVANTVLSFGSASYDLKNNASVIYAPPNETFTYGGIYPDGSFVMSATNYRTWAFGGSLLYSTATGESIPATGWPITNGGTTAFSPDGKHIAFIHEDLDDGAGHTLGMMDFDLSGYAFSNLQDVATDPQNTIGWPAFTPDITTIVFHSGSNENFETDGGATGNIYQVDIPTKKVTRLAALDGYDANGMTYLPAMDPDLNFAPTVLPEAVGGYFWTVFTSHRSYGNTLPSQDNGDQNGKLWVAALDINHTAGVDSSHPAFYLDGQESGADNLRGFWVLPPCKALAAGCASGDQCCSGYCTASGSQSTCTAEPVNGCSLEYEKCTTTANCCNASQGYQCIGGFCSEPAAMPPK